MTTTYTEDQQTAAAVAADLALRLAGAEVEIKTVKIDGEDFHVVPSGMKIEKLEEFRQYPVRFKGVHMVEDVPSFGKLVKHFDGHERMILICQPSLSVVAILNFPTAEGPAFRDHRIKLQLAKHRDLKAWEDKCGKSLSQVDFMVFLEDRILDVTQQNAPKDAPSQSILQGVIGDLTVTTEAKFTSKKDLHNGNYVFQTDSNGTPSVEVPRTFYIAIPIFEGDKERYLVPVRLNYSIKEGNLTFKISLANFDRIFEDAWNKVRDSVIAVLPEGMTHLNVPVIDQQQ